MLTLTVVEGSGPSLTGRNWLSTFPLDWKQIHLINSALQEELSHHAPVSANKLGTLKGLKFLLRLILLPSPDFVRPAPYRIPCAHSNWAAPIDPILNINQKSVRICGDFKFTMNQAAKVDHYPIPKIEDLFLWLSGGKVYSKLDLSHTYQKLLLQDEHSKKLLVINRQKGCFVTPCVLWCVFIVYSVQVIDQWCRSHVILVSGCSSVSVLLVCQSVYFCCVILSCLHMADL